MIGVNRRWRHLISTTRVRYVVGGPEYLLGVANAFETPLAAAFIGYYGCCCGDTWGSELGVLSKKLPRLIINPAKEVGTHTSGLLRRFVCWFVGWLLLRSNRLSGS